MTSAACLLSASSLQSVHSSTGLSSALHRLVRLISSLHPSPLCRAAAPVSITACSTRGLCFPPPPQCLRLGFIKLPPCSFFNLALTTAHCCIPFASRVELLGIFLSLSSRQYSGSYTVYTASAIKESKNQIRASEQSPSQRARAHW
jgi:hypothetical protein